MTIRATLSVSNYFRVYGVGRFISVCLCALSFSLVSAEALADRSSIAAYKMLSKRLQSSKNLSKDSGTSFLKDIWFKDMEGRLERWVTKPEELQQILTSVYDYGLFYDLKPELLLAVMQVESGFDRFAISHVGARGLMQIMPFWQTKIGKPSDNLLEAETNVRYGCIILGYYINWEKGDIVKALARYNGSVGRTIYSEKVLKAWQKNWFVSYD